MVLRWVNVKWQMAGAASHWFRYRSFVLLAYGLGWPPTWCTTAATAEAWALQVVLQQCPFPPQMRTDCMSLLSTARAGTAKTTHHSRLLARVWKCIADTIGADISTLISGGKLAWMPAHKSLTMVGETKLSNGCRLSLVDWRANRLVDALAKAAASKLQAPKTTLAFLASAEAASAHASCLLGVVTYAANHYQEVTTSVDGTTEKKVLRDSAEKPRTKRALSVPTPVSAVRTTPATSDHPVTDKPWRPPPASVVAKRRRVEEETLALSDRVEQIGSSMKARSSSLTGSQRLAALAERVGARARS